MSTAPVYNESMPKGGDPLEVDVNAQYVGYEFNYVYIAFCAFIVFLILPGLGFFYGGLARRKSALTLLFQSFMVTAVITFQWMFWGYSLAYSRTAGPFIGDLANFGLINVSVAPSIGNSTIPEIVFCLFQLLFCACTVQVLVGGAFERGRIVPSLVFGFWWATVVYCPIACWTWNPSGWLYNLPSLDFAGGGPVHIASGWSALAYALVLGPRRGLAKKKGPGLALGRRQQQVDGVLGASANDNDDRRGRLGHTKPHNTTLVFLGTTLIWFGWFGFNGGSALNASVRAMYAAFNTNTAACAGLLGWVAVDYYARPLFFSLFPSFSSSPSRHHHRGGRRFSVVGACQGAIAGLVGITPAAGYVSLWLAAVVGFLTAVVCALTQDVNEWLGVDDGLAVFHLHGIGGMCGSFLTGLFATASVAMLDGVTEASGAIDGNGVQVGLQLAEICAISAYSFVVSVLLLLIMKYIPGMNLRVSEEAEDLGLDMDQFFDEQIGDWSYFEEADRFRPTTTILGQVASSTTEQASREDKGSSGEEVKGA